MKKNKTQLWRLRITNGGPIDRKKVYEDLKKECSPRPGERVLIKTRKLDGTYRIVKTITL